MEVIGRKCETVKIDVEPKELVYCYQKKRMLPWNASL